MKRDLSPSALFALGSVFLAGAVMLLQSHVTTLRQIRDESLPLASAIPPLERRLQVLQQQSELSRVQAQLRTGSPEEKLNVSVLPSTLDRVRVLAFFEFVRSRLESDGQLHRMSQLTIGEPVQIDGAPAGDDGSALVARTVRFEADVSDEGLSRLLSFIDLSGLLTVGDALSPQEADALFSLTEAENYAGIVPLEQFLAADLLAYAREPELYEDQVLRSLSSENFLREFRQSIRTSRLQAARELLGGEAAKTLQRNRLWPTPFFALQGITLTTAPDGQRHAVVAVALYGRTPSR